MQHKENDFKMFVPFIFLNVFVTTCNNIHILCYYYCQHYQLLYFLSQRHYFRFNIFLKYSHCFQYVTKIKSLSGK